MPLRSSEGLWFVEDPDLEYIGEVEGGGGGGGGLLVGGHHGD